MALYNEIGKGYNRSRTADSRILQHIKELLDLPVGSTIADIGAGTGNYTNALAGLGYLMRAIEPSEEMRGQAIKNKNVEWVSGIAEEIPLPADSVDGVIIILAIHHFTSLKCAGDEIYRICPEGPVVIFTIDPRESDEFWFKAYFPEIYQHDFEFFPLTHKIVNTIAGNHGWSHGIQKIPLPHDFKDLNMYSGWNRPEIYLDEQMRQNTSGFAIASESVVKKGLSLLKQDLQSGAWDEKHGHLRNQASFDAGFRFLKFDT